MPMNFLMQYLINIPKLGTKLSSQKKKRKEKKLNSQKNIKCNLSSLVGVLVIVNQKKKKL